MAVALSTLLNRLAYRFRENSSPDDTNEKARRISAINEGYRKICGERYWWFLKTIASDTSIADQEIYTLPSDFRDMIEVRLDGKLYTPILEKDAFGSEEYPPSAYSSGYSSGRCFIYGEDELHLIPIPDSAPSALSVSSITHTSGTATVTTSTAHGLEANNFVTIAGADQSGYNGAFRILSAPSTVTFTISVATTTVTPATGTMTATERNIIYRYWAYATDLSADTDTIIIPSLYSDILPAYAYGRLKQVKGLRGSAGDGFEEYNQIYMNMLAEQNRRKFMYKNR